MTAHEGFCIFCAGTGKIDREPCVICGGTGIVIEIVSQPDEADEFNPIEPI